MAKVITAITAFSLVPLVIAGAERLTFPIRMGFSGLDSSHCTAFTQILNHEGNMGHLAGVIAFASAMTPAQTAQEGVS